MHKKLRVKRLLQYTAAALFWITVWVLVAKRINLDLIFPSIPSVFTAMKGLLSDMSFYRSCLSSIEHILIGWVSGCSVGIIIGVLSFSNSWAQALFAPVLHIVKATPVASFIILLLVLMSKTRSLLPAVIAALIVIPVVSSNTVAGLESPDKKLLEMAEAFRMKPKKRIADIYIPALKSYLIPCVTTSMGLAWKAGIAAEVISTPADTIGAAIFDSKVYLDTPGLFAWTIAVIVLSVLFEGLIKLVVKLIAKNGGGKKNEG